MTREEIFEKLNIIFQSVFEDESIELNDNTSTVDIADWDSFEHINLIIAIEDEFSIKIPVGKALTMKYAGVIADYIFEVLNN